jgi:hypothetical protein
MRTLLKLEEIAIFVGTLLAFLWVYSIPKVVVYYFAVRA